MELNSSPRKQIPLARGDETPRKPSAPSLTRRVFYCGVVVEGCDSGRRLPEDVQDLVLSLGDPWLSENDSHILPSATDTSFSEHHQPDGLQRKRALTDSTALTDVVNELVNTERSYVKRLRILKNDYADPLRQFSRNKNTAILPSYEAKTLFGNIDNLLPVNEAFLLDLEKMVAPGGPETIGGVGDVALRHFKDLRGFEHYRQYYVKREEAQSIFEREMMKKSSGFAAYIDRIKYSNADSRNRVGLRELLMDPVQRIPRYTLLFRTMIKYMASGDSQRVKLVEADDIASKIALAETDEQTKRAAIMHCLNATVDGFPPGLISISRRFIDCIDVDDIVQDGPSASTSVSSLALNVLHCTLFLFDDKLMIVKRPGNGEKSGRSLAGLDDVDKLAKTGGLPLRMKKSGLSCKGVIDLPDIVAADIGGADFHVYIENPPQDQSDRWSGRSFRCLSVVFPPAPVNLDPARTINEKDRFLENLWNAQAKYRTKTGQSVVLCADEHEVESRGGRVTMARTYFNVYQRTAFLQEPKKTKIVMHIDTLGTADPIPFGMNGPPYVVVRIQPMAGEISRYTVTSSDPSDESEEDIVQTARIPGRIVQTIHQYGLFKFKTSNDSRPATPTASSRSRAHIFSLDAISRNLFNAIPGSSKGDFFGGSISGHRRSKSSASRSSIYTQTTTTTGDGSLTKFSHRSNSTATAPTSLADDESLYASKSSSSRKKLVKRSRSPGTSHSSPLSRQTSLSRNSSRTSFYSDGEEELPVRQDPSDQDLSLRLELARRNSQNQHGKQAVKPSLERPAEETIYEDDPPRPLRPTSRASVAASQRSTTPRPTSTSPSRGTGTGRPHSRFGPRSISPLPPKSPTSTAPDLPSMDDELALEAHIALDAHIDSFQDDSSFTEDDAPSPLPRSRRQPFVATGTLDSTPRQSSSTTGSVEPLSIKKKPSTRSSTYTSSRKSYTRISPLSKSTARIVSPRKVSPQIRIARVAPASHSAQVDHADELLRISLSTKDDVRNQLRQLVNDFIDNTQIESSHRVIKRMKLDLQEIRASDEIASLDESRRCSSPDKSLARTPQRIIPQPITKEAQQRLDEMRQLIGKRQQEGTSRSRPRSFVTELPTPGPPATLGTSNISLLNESVADADKLLASALSSHETLHQSLTQVVSDFKQKLTDLEKARVELQNTKRQCELVKSLLADATAEKEIMYEAFNEELDAMYNDAHLPDNEAWTNMTADLRESKESQNAMRKENSQLKRRLAEVESEKEEWGTLLRAHGLIP